MSMTNKDFRARARIGTQLAVAAAAAALLSAPEVRAQTVYNGRCRQLARLPLEFIIRPSVPRLH